MMIDDLRDTPTPTANGQRKIKEPAMLTVAEGLGRVTGHLMGVTKENEDCDWGRGSFRGLPKHGNQVGVPQA